MKLNSITILVFSAILALSHASCTLTPDQQAAITTNALKDGGAAGIGYLLGGKPGAAAALTAQVIQDHSPATTAGKQPVNVTAK